jgi:hypothetical protein
MTEITDLTSYLAKKYGITANGSEADSANKT